CGERVADELGTPLGLPLPLEAPVHEGASCFIFRHVADATPCSACYATLGALGPPISRSVISARCSANSCGWCYLSPVLSHPSQARRSVVSGTTLEPAYVTVTPITAE